MSTQILMPALSPTMTEGKLARWLKNVGDTVKSGDVIAEIETDKATMEVEAVDEGTITNIMVPEGTEGVAVNSPIAELDGGAGGAAQTVHGITNKNPRENEKMIAESGTKQRSEVTVPAEPRAAEAEKDWGPTATITVREALRDAMAAEMRADKDVFLMGEEV